MTLGYTQNARLVLNGLQPGRFEHARTIERPGILDNAINIVLTERWEIEETVNNLIARAQRHISNTRMTGE